MDQEQATSINFLFVFCSVYNIYFNLGSCGRTHTRSRLVLTYVDTDEVDIYINGTPEAILEKGVT